MQKPDKFDHTPPGGLFARASGDAWRMSAFYAAVCAGTGVSLPFIGRWFAAHGLTGGEIGVVLGAPMLARLVTGPMLSVWADSYRLRRTAILILALTMLGAYAAIGVTTGFALWLALWFVGATALGALMPLGDVLTLKRSRRGGFAFAVPRGVGSFVFIVANVIIGALLTWPGAKGSVELVVIWIVAAAAVLAAVCAFVLPREPVSESGPVARAERFHGLGRLVADPSFMAAIVSVGLIQATHAFYYGFSTLIWKAQGLSDQTMGLLWGVGVTAEVVFFWFMEPWRRRVGPRRLVVLAGIGALVRWTAFAVSPPLWLLWPLQVLHALSFSAAYIGGLHLVEELAPPQTHSAGQTLSSALSGGVFIGLATILSGALYDRYGALGYLAMSVMALGGLVLALRLALASPSAAPGAEQRP